MLEQTVLHGPLYMSQIKGKTLISKPVVIQDVKFGPMRSITIYKESAYVIVKDNRTREQYQYQQNTLVETNVSYTPTNEGFSYFYGMAQYLGQLHPYFIQNQPIFSIPHIPDIHTFTLPQTLQSLDYKQIFTYPQPLLQLLQHLPATYTDIYKRPITQIGGRTYPIAITKVKTTVHDLIPSTYPIVIDLANTNFAVVDLEPNSTENDRQHFASLQGYYREDTPRGGKHLLVTLDSDIYKFRYSPQLEVINEGAITMYGINAVWENDTPPPLNVDNYAHTNTTSLNAPTTYTTHCDNEQQTQIMQYVQMLTQLHNKKYTGSQERAKQQYHQDSDTSHGEYLVLYVLWKQDIKPYQTQLPQLLLPWILQSYAVDCIPWREKHETQRNGVPYLIHLCQRIIAWDSTQ